MTLLKYIAIFFLLGLWVSQASFGLERIDQDLVWSNFSAEVTIQFYVQILLGFLYIVAVLVGLYGGFRIFTAWGDDEKVKKWKDAIIYMIIGLIIIFLAGSIVQFVLAWILDPSLAEPQQP